MLGIVLLALAIILYIGNKKKWSILLFVFFSMDGLRLMTNEALGMKTYDIAFIYTIVICLYSVIYEKRTHVENRIIRQFVICLFLFLICSALFSLYYYKFTIIQIIQGGRSLFIFLCYFFIRKLHLQDIHWIIKALYYITLLHAVLYVIQVITGLPILPYSLAEKIDNSTGLRRYYNYPLLLPFFLFMLMIAPQYLHLKNQKTAWTIFILALICTLGRTYITTTILCMMVGLILKGTRFKKILIYICLGCLFFVLFSDVLIARFEKGGETKNDIEEIISGEYINRAYTGNRKGEGTLTYRLTWVAERVIYLSERPIGEQLFGLGMISDSQESLVQRLYQFQHGAYSKESGNIYQLKTADIAYGNIITQFGYLGSFILLSLWIYILYFGYHYSKIHPYSICLTQLILFYVIDSVSGTTISETGYLAFPFLLVTCIVGTKRKYYVESGLCVNKNNNE